LSFLLAFSIRVNDLFLLSTSIPADRSVFVLAELRAVEHSYDRFAFRPRSVYWSSLVLSSTLLGREFRRRLLIAEDVDVRTVGECIFGVHALDAFADALFIGAHLHAGMAVLPAHVVGNGAGKGRGAGEHTGNQGDCDRLEHVSQYIRC